MSQQTNYLPALGRLLIAAIFVFSGIGKIATPAATQAYIAAMGLPLPPLAYAISIAVEVGGGLLLIAGFQTRAVAAMLAVFSLLTALAFHHAWADPNQLIHFLKNVSMAGGLLQVVAFGAGALSLDASRHLAHPQRAAA